MVGGRSLPLQAADDERYLSPLVCLMRSQLEVFSATTEDIRRRATIGGIAPPIRLGQVGIRCVHCKDAPHAEQAKGSSSYPTSLRVVYQTVRNWQRYHFGHCQHISPGVRDAYDRHMSGKRCHSSRSSQEYWVDSCRKMGLADVQNEVAKGGGKTGGGSGVDSSSSGGTFVMFQEDALQLGLQISTTAASNVPGIKDAATIRNGSGKSEKKKKKSVKVQRTSPPKSNLESVQQSASSSIASLASTIDIDDDDCLLKTYSQGSPDQDELVVTAEEATDVQSDICGLSSFLSTSCNIIGPDSLPSTIARLNLEIWKLPHADTDAYYRAVELCPDQDERKKKFIEHEGGDVKKAAKKLAGYWQARLKLFGPHRAYLPMTLDGAMKDDAKSFAQRKLCQQMPVTDTAGRALLYFAVHRSNFRVFSIEQEMRGLWWLLEHIIEDPTLRRKGVVVLVDVGGVQLSQTSRKFATHMSWLMNDGLPIRIRAVHTFNVSPLVQYVIRPLVMRLIAKNMRLRNTFHHGDQSAILSSLKGFCLPKDRLPTEMGGDIDLSMDQNQMVFESSTSAPPPLPPTISHKPSKNNKKKKRSRQSEGIANRDDADIALYQKMRRTRDMLNIGRKPDERMELAQTSGWNVPSVDALLNGGFTFPGFSSKEDMRTGKLKAKDIMDANGISLRQRKDQLNRRIRQAEQLIKDARALQRGESDDNSRDEELHASSNVEGDVSQTLESAAPPALTDAATQEDSVAEVMLEMAMGSEEIPPISGTNEAGKEEEEEEEEVPYVAV